MQVEGYITLLKIRFGGSAIISMINVDTLMVGEFLRRLHPTMIIVSPMVVIPEEIVEIATKESIAIRWMS